MGRLSRVATIPLVVMVAAILIWHLFPTDARRIRAACLDLAHLASVSPNEPDLARITRTAGFARHLAPDIVVEAEGVEQRLEGRETIVAYLSRFSSSPLGITVTLDEVQVGVDDGGSTATARTVVTAREPDPRGGPDIVETRDLTMGWSRRDDGWRLARALVGRSEDPGTAPR